MDAAFNDGATSFYIASHNGHVVRVLLADGAAMDAAINDGDMPLLMACLFERVEVARELLAHGAAVNHASNDGATVLSYALYRENAALEALLRPAGAV